MAPLHWQQPTVLLHEARSLGMTPWPDPGMALDVTWVSAPRHCVSHEEEGTRSQHPLCETQEAHAVHRSPSHDSPALGNPSCLCKGWSWPWKLLGPSEGPPQQTGGEEAPLHVVWSQLAP